jgi:hypothetical protein
VSEGAKNAARVHGIVNPNTVDKILDKHQVKASGLPTEVCVDVCVFICMHTCVYLCVYICMHIYTCVNICMHIFTHTKSHTQNTQNTQTHTAHTSVFFFRWWGRRRRPAPTATG